MTYQEDYFLPEDHPSAKAQRQAHEKIISAVKKYFKLDHPPSYTFLGLNPFKYVEELEQSKEGKSPKELKEIDKKIIQLRGLATNHDKYIFDFNDILERLVITSGQVPITGMFGTAHYDRWTVLLKCHVSDQFIFGRVCKRARHGSGTYCFAPINLPIAELEKILEKKSQDIGSDKALSDIIQADPLHKLLDDIRNTKEAMDQIRTMMQLLDEKQPSGIKLIDTLNQNKDLVKKMKSVGHFGAVQQGLSLFSSDADISTVCLPLKSATFIQLVSFEIYGHTKSIEGLFSLVNALKQIGD